VLWRLLSYARDTLKQLMIKKEIVGDLLNHLRLARQRALAAERAGSGEESDDWAAGRAAAMAGGSMDASSFGPEDEEALNETLGELLLVLEQLDERIGPMLEQDGSHFNKRWVVLHAQSSLLSISVTPLLCDDAER
jgi:hypothetical protein